MNKPRVITHIAAAAIAVCGLLGLSQTALADSITPGSYSTSLAVGESTTIRKTVTVSAGTPTSAKVDVFFLFDTTGSMGSVLSAAKSTASTVMTAVSGLGDVSFGVGSYDDFPVYPYGSSGDDPYTLEQGITADTTAVGSAISGLFASGGNDWPESQLTALTGAADAATGWRDGSTRILLWFGDAYGHEGTESGYPGTATTASTSAALAANNINVNAIDFNSGSSSGLDGTGQATAITSATGGSVYAGSTDPSVYAALVESSIYDIFSSYSEVCLNPNGNLPGVDVSTSPCYNGAYDRSIERTFDFDVTFTGLEPGTHDFTIDALVDKGIVARELDSITVRGAAAPEPATLALLGLGLAGIGLGRRRLQGR